MAGGTSHLQQRDGLDLQNGAYKTGGIGRCLKVLTSVTITLHTGFGVSLAVRS